MTEALEHLRKALDHLEDARDKSAFGTGLMIDELIEKVEQLITRTENINDGEE